MVNTLSYPALFFVKKAPITGQKADLPDLVGCLGESTRESVLNLCLANLPESIQASAGSIHEM